MTFPHRLLQLEQELGQYNQRLALTYRLSPGLAALLTLLMKEPAIQLGGRERMRLHRLRQALKPYNVQIHTNRVGYRIWLDAETKQRMCEALVAYEGVVQYARNMMEAAL
jgi:hypothetical protein